MRKTHAHLVPWLGLSLAAGLFLGCGGANSPETASAATTPASSPALTPVDPTSPEAAVVFRKDVTVLDDQREVDSQGAMAEPAAAVVATPVLGSANHLNLRGNAQALAAVRPNGVFVSGHRAYRAQSVAQTSEGLDVETREQPAFEEVVESVNLAGNVLLSNQHIQAQSMPNSVRLGAKGTQASTLAATPNGSLGMQDTGDALVFSLSNFVIVDLDGNPDTTYDQILANGNVTLDKPTISFNVKWKFLQPPTAKLNFHAGESAHLSVSTPSFGFSKTYEVPIAGFQVPIPGTLGAVTIGGKISLIFSASGQIQASVVFDQFATVDAGLVGEGFPWKVKPYSTVDSGFTIVPSITGELDLGAYVSPRLSLLVLQYDLAGLYAKLGIEASAKGVISPSAQCLTLGVNGKVGVNGYFKIPFFSVDKEIYSHTWPIYNQQWCNNQ